MKGTFMKNRYYKRFICIVLCVVMICILIGCTEASAAMRRENMTLVDKSTPFRIYRHDSTGVYYLVCNYGGISIMVNADGTPYTGVAYN